MFIQILILFATLLVLPGYFLYSLWRGRENSKFNWLLKVLYSGAFLLYVVLAGNWSWLSYYLRFVIPILFVLAVFISYQRVRHLPFFARSRGWGWLSSASSLLALLVFSGFLAFTLRGYFYSDPPVQLVFPLQAGRYYVGQGGNSPVLNYHNVNQAQQYALDITELNAAGTRAWGLYPAKLERYVIFGATVRSPCDGTILEAVDGLPDNIPPATDLEHLAGNHVVITCQGVNVVLAHLQNGSVTVQTGETVTTGQPLGQVGNSGNTSEPHLHIHAVAEDSGDVLAGEGVPLLFESKFPVRNSILSSSGPASLIGGF